MALTTGLTAAELTATVDAGASANAAQRARLLFAYVADDGGDDASLAVRDAWLLELRCATFGDVLEAHARCPACSTRLALEVPRELVPLAGPADGAWTPERVVVELDGGVVVEARAPDGTALLAAAACGDAASARMSLLRSCVTSVTRDGEALSVDDLSEADVARVGEAIADAEPGVEVALDVSCAACGHEWRPVLDIAQFFWRELEAASVQILDDVHELATAYGWPEPEILRLSAHRRREYVERIARG